MSAVTDYRIPELALVIGVLTLVACMALASGASTLLAVAIVGALLCVYGAVGMTS